ncbi:MAG: GIY-YIG nuclease family protein [Oxalobacteraceae bacterium]|nr:MAG: GIY-YIG nuclease family protein [Oxalobacteraceae bacterium]
MFYVYAIQSQKDSRIYVGMTSDVVRRLNEHNSGKNRSTAFYKPWQLVYTEQALTRLEARKREIWLKSGVGKEYLKNWLRSSTDRIDVS